jgi:hypothetical protein
VTALGALVVLAIWFLGIHPAKGLAKGTVAEIRLATNRRHQTLWQTGYHPEDCAEIPPAEHAYTCRLSGSALEQVTRAVAGPNRSYYLLGQGQEPVPDPVHAISFRMTGGEYYALLVRSLEEADAGIFYGYWATGTGIISHEIRWFRYKNAALGQALRDLRRAR